MLKQLLIREGKGCRYKGEAEEKPSTALEEILVLPEGIHVTKALGCSAELNFIR